MAYYQSNLASEALDLVDANSPHSLQLGVKRLRMPLHGHAKHILTSKERCFDPPTSGCEISKKHRQLQSHKKHLKLLMETD